MGFGCGTDAFPADFSGRFLPKELVAAETLVHQELRVWPC